MLRLAVEFLDLPAVDPGPGSLAAAILARIFAERVTASAASVKFVMGHPDAGVLHLARPSVAYIGAG